MHINQSLNHSNELNLEKLPLKVLRARWSEAWGLKPHSRIGRTMLIRSLNYKIHEQQTSGKLNFEYQQRLNQLIKLYKRNPKYFEESRPNIKPGTRLVRDWNGKRYSVLIKNSGYQYKDKIYTSLSQVASEITGTRWNGWVFFGLKKKEAK